MPMELVITGVFEAVGFSRRTSGTTARITATTITTTTGMTM